MSIQEDIPSDEPHTELFDSDGTEITKELEDETTGKPNAASETEEDASERETKKSGDSEQQAESDDQASETERESEEPDKPRIPVAALQQERVRRQQAEEQLREMGERYARLDERLNHIQEATRKPVEVPNKDEDPVAYLEYENRQLQERLKPLEEGQTAQREYAEQQAAINEVSSRTQAFEAEFQRDHPDYHDAVDFLKDQAAERYRIMGVNDPMQLQQLLTRDSLTLAHNAMTNGQNPAEVAYKLAETSGYQAETKDNGSVEDKLETIERGQRASASLSRAGGDGVPTDLTIEALANMDDDEFSKISNVQWRKMLGNT